MALYTFIMDFAGGTYCSQARGRSPAAAARRWARDLDVCVITGMGQAIHSELIRDIFARQPAKLDGLHKVWCYTARIHGKLTLINIVLSAN